MKRLKRRFALEGSLRVARRSRGRQAAATLTGERDRYYDAVIAAVTEAGPLFIFGPGEAKGELKKRLEAKGLGARVAAIETADKMTDPQIAEKVRKFFSEP
jgi:hypothetical protein